MGDIFTHRKYWNARRRERRAYGKLLKKRFKADPASFNPYNKETPR